MARQPNIPPQLPPAPKAVTKQAQIIEMLRQENGASLCELASAMGWLPHTTRATLTGLRKRGHAIAKNSVDGVTRYRIAAA